MEITPNSNIYILYGVPLNSKYNDTILFDNVAAQHAYFVSKAKYTLSNQMYVRKSDGVVRVEKKAEDVYNSVHNAEVDEKLALLAEKEQILSDINDYSVNIAEADRLSDFMPEGNSEVRAKLVEALESVEPNANLMGDINISEYEVSIEVRCYDIETPTKYVRALIDQDYFTE